MALDPTIATTNTANFGNNTQQLFNAGIAYRRQLVHSADYRFQPIYNYYHNNIMCICIYHSPIKAMMHVF